MNGDILLSFGDKMRTWFQIIYSFVSKYAAHHFKEHNYDVYDINRNTKPLIEGVTLIEGNRHELGKKLKDIHFDVVSDITAYDADGIIDLYEALGHLIGCTEAEKSMIYETHNDSHFMKGVLIRW